MGVLLICYSYGYIKYSSSGISVTYFEGENFEHFIETKVSKNIYIDSSGSPNPQVSPDHFSIRYSGYLLSAKSEQTALKVTSDDGVRLWVNNILVVNDWSPHPLKSHENTVQLKKGENKFQLEYFDKTGEAKLDLLWKQSSEKSYKRIPTRALRHE